MASVLVGKVSNQRLLLYSQRLGQWDDFLHRPWHALARLIVRDRRLAEDDTAGGQLRP